MLQFNENNGVLSVHDERIKKGQPRTAYEKVYVRSLFDKIAHRYDLLNHLLSFGIDLYWRAKAIQLLRKYQPERILDIATGTADLAIKASALHPKQIIGIDISEEMLRIGRQKISERKLEHLISLQTGDAEQLDFADDSFDAVTVAFGVRNFSDLRRGFTEMQRVLCPGGTAVILEFSQPRSFPVKQLYRFYSRWILPAIGGLISKHREAYEYLPKTVTEFPDGEELLSILRESGFTTTEHHPLTFGITTVYVGIK